MKADSIIKELSGWKVAPNLKDYNEARASFSWDAVRRDLDGLPGGGLNIAHEAVDRHADGARRYHVALRWIDRAGAAHDYTYGRLRALTNRFANALRSLGIEPGDRVFVLSERIPELYVAALGTLKHRSVFCSLFSAYGPEPIRTRLALGRGKVLVTTERLYRRKVKQIRRTLPDLKHVIVVGNEGTTPGGSDTIDFHRLLSSVDEAFTIPPTDPEDAALLHFTSGTTGTPKGVVHVHAAVIGHYATGRLVLDLHPDDVFWCTADPGWVTGVSYGIIAPLVAGVTMIADQEEFNAERWYGLLQDQRVTVWYTAPTAIRLLMKYGERVAGRYDLSGLRLLTSVGEPLHAEAVWWSVKVFGHPIHDTWWQTETGSIMIANFAAMDVRSGSMGRPMPGVEAAVIHRKKGGQIKPVQEPEATGELALRAPWPSMFRAYLDDQARYQDCFVGDWYLTGDLVRRDRDGYFWFVGRADDVIKSAGHLIGPVEVEQVLMEHPAVAEVGVIGRPDEVAGAVVKAFVSLKPGYEVDEALRLDLRAHARKRLGPVVAPKEIAFQPVLPKTESGKIVRRLLQAQERGSTEANRSHLDEPNEAEEP